MTGSILAAYPTRHPRAGCESVVLDAHSGATVTKALPTTDSSISAEDVPGRLSLHQLPKLRGERLPSPRSRMQRRVLWVVAWCVAESRALGLS